MRSVGREALFSLAALLVSVILVQSLYATVIRPRAAAILAEPAIPQDQLKPGQAVPHNLRSPYVILKDYEQEVALILATWALSLIAYQEAAVARNRRLLDKPYIELGEGHVVLPDDARAYGRPIEALPREEQEMLLPRALMVALNRFGATRSVQDAAEALRAECENELDRLDAQLSMVRFTAWADSRGRLRRHRCAASVARCRRRRERCAGTSPASPRVSASPSTQRSPPWCAASSSCSACTSCSRRRTAWSSTPGSTSTGV